MFVKVFKASQCLRGAVYRKTVWSVRLTTILGLDASTVLGKFGEMPRSDNAELHTERARECVLKCKDESIIPRQKNTAEIQSISASVCLKEDHFRLGGLSLVSRSTGGPPKRSLSTNPTTHHTAFLTVNICSFRVFLIVKVHVVTRFKLTEGVDQIHLHVVGYQRIGQLREETLHGSSHCVYRYILLDQVNVWI